MAVTYDILADPVNAIHTLVGSIFDSIFITLGGEMRNRQPERDLSEVFSKGVVRASFKLSDLARLLKSREESKPFEGIEMPTL